MYPRAVKELEKLVFLIPELKNARFQYYYGSLPDIITNDEKLLEKLKKLEMESTLCTPNNRSFSLSVDGVVFDVVQSTSRLIGSSTIQEYLDEQQLTNSTEET